MSTPAPPDTLWRSSEFLHLRRWDDEFIAYHSLSGDTHLLDLAAGQLLLALQKFPADTRSLSHTRSSDLETEVESSLPAQLPALEALSLIERDPS